MQILGLATILENNQIIYVERCMGRFVVFCWVLRWWFGFFHLSVVTTAFWHWVVGLGISVLCWGEKNTNDRNLWRSMIIALYGPRSITIFVFHTPSTQLLCYDTVNRRLIRLISLGFFRGPICSMARSQHSFLPYCKYTTRNWKT